jgi:hypothetical protein
VLEDCGNGVINLGHLSEHLLLIITIKFSGHIDQTA